MKIIKNKKLFKKILTIALAVVVLGGIVIGGVYYYQNQKTEEQDINQNQQESQIDTSDWQTYTNNDLGFSIKYPPEFKEMDLRLAKAGEARVVKGSLWQGGIPYDEAPNFRILITSYGKDYEGWPRGLNFVDYQIFEEKDNSYYLKSGLSTESELVFPYKKIGENILLLDENSIPKENFMMQPPSGRGAIINLMGNNFTGMSITKNDTYIDKNFFDEMIESIEVFEPKVIQDSSSNTTNNKINISNWKTYKNKEIGFEFQYPAQFTFTSEIKYWDEEKKKPGKEAWKDYMGSRFYGALYLDNDRRTYSHIVFLSSDYKEIMGRGASFEDYNRYVFKEDENKYYFGRFWDDKLDEIKNPVEKITVNNKEGIIIDYSNFLKENRCEAMGISLPYMGALVRTGIDKYPLVNISFSEELTDSEKCTFTKVISDEEAVKIIKSFKFLK